MWELIRIQQELNHIQHCHHIDTLNLILPQIQDFNLLHCLYYALSLVLHLQMDWARKKMTQHIKHKHYCTFVTYLCHDKVHNTRALAHDLQLVISTELLLRYMYVQRNHVRLHDCMPSYGSGARYSWISINQARQCMYHSVIIVMGPVKIGHVS